MEIKLYLIIKSQQSGLVVFFSHVFIYLCSFSYWQHGLGGKKRGLEYLIFREDKNLANKFSNLGEKNT